ncbi:unnamed protein product [Cyclocybe aegerita]|uniref:Heme peroxidase n=1 Tax=Cyclocybe aegerita TaxID=1973307 RepID=A0A8S0W0W8_CYCAE|nr:unnamed protein product [Cyclocybe aegerita]
MIIATPGALHCIRDFCPVYPCHQSSLTSAHRQEPIYATLENPKVLIASTMPPIIRPLLQSLHSLILLIIMSLMRRFSKRIDYFNDSRAPLDTDGAIPVTRSLEKTLDAVIDQLHRPAISTSDLPAIWDAIRNMNSVGLDDRKLLLEKLIQIMSRSKDYAVSKKMQQMVINLLYKDLPHPPTGYLCSIPVNPSQSHVPQTRVKYAFRSADGSNNNPLFPTLGQAGSPYARSVSSTRIIPKSALPDPGLVFDTLLKRDKFEKHPAGISALFFAFADLVIHSIFNTNHTDWTINDASSYLDLSILYGSSDQEVDSIRKKDGSGALYEDVFADKRLLMMPPASCALLVLLSRNHNFIAQRIRDINENGNYNQNPQGDAIMLQDDEIFHRARLVNCGYFMQIILGDYVGAILGLVRDETDWRLNPLMTMRELDHDFAPTGEGNVCSVEFNLLYRWHATLSEPDTEWITGFFDNVFEGADPSTVTTQDFKRAAHKKLIVEEPVTKWEFGRIKREVSGRFKDEDLARLLQSATKAYAGAFKARGIPEALRVIEIMGIQQSRSWGTCSLNEFRKFLGLKPYASFKEWNPDPEIYDAAQALYRDIDNLELHVGLQAEEAKKPGPGAGLCPGYTISRAILADAVSLSRGDRFLTADFNPFNFTSWGYQYCQYDPQDGSYGGLLTKLLFQMLPDFYPRGSAYAHFPFLVPEYMEDHMRHMSPDLVDKYTWTEPRRLSPTVAVDRFVDVKKVLEDESAYLSAYGGRLFKTVEPQVVKKKDTVRGEDRRVAAIESAKRKLIAGAADVSKAIFNKPDPEFASYFVNKTKTLIENKSFDKVGSKTKCVDIVKDVINLLPIHWASDILGLPLKTYSNPQGVWYEEPTYQKWADVARYVYLNYDPVDDWKLQGCSQEASKEILEMLQPHLDHVASTFRFSISDAHNHMGIGGKNSHMFLKKLWHKLGKNYTRTEFTAQVFAAVIPTVALYSQAVAHIVDFYLDQDKQVAREEILRLAALMEKEKDACSKIMGYAYEALRLNPPIAGVYRTAAQDAILGSAVEVKAGNNVFASISNANQDSSVFGPEPAHADYLRAASNPGLASFIGETGLLTSEFFQSTVPGVLAAIFKLKDLQRGPGLSGSFTRFKEDFYGTQATRYINSSGHITPLADSLVIQFAQ